MEELILGKGPAHDSYRIDEAVEQGSAAGSASDGLGAQRAEFVGLVLDSLDAGDFGQFAISPYEAVVGGKRRPYRVPPIHSRE